MAKAATGVYTLKQLFTVQFWGSITQQQIAAKERALIGRKIPGYFPTPKPVVERMLAAADIKPGMDVLEPSAGKGNIADAIKHQEGEAKLSTIEPVSDLRSILEAKGHTVAGHDFLEHQGQHDRIVMHPPFEGGQDIDHVRHAFEQLKPGGRVVAIMSEGPFFRGDKKASEFRAWLESVGGTSEKLPAGAFQSSERPTGVNTRMVVINKPGGVRSAKSEVRSLDLGPRTANGGLFLATGKTAPAITERGTEVQTRFGIVDAGDLVASHDTALNPNPKYPAELQPRDRSRLASEEQVSRIASNLRPEFLGESPKASEGAPIVGKDLAVGSGNGRVIAIQRAYDSGNEGGQRYRQYLSDHAAEFGLKPEDIAKAKNPVLVRVREEHVDRVQFAREANEQSVAAMSAVEQAKTDAAKLSGLMDQFFPNDEGEINTAANRGFIRSFMDQVVGPAERGRYVTSDGQLSQEGINRIRNAVFARAYADSPEGIAALEKLAASPDNNVRTVTTALLHKAGKFAALKEAIADGSRHDLDLTGDLTESVKKLSALREQGQTVNDYLNQGSLFGEELTPLQKRVLQVFDENKRSSKRIGDILDHYLGAVEELGNPKQGAFFEQAAADKEALFEAAVKEANSGQGQQTSLFAGENQGLQPRPGTGEFLSPFDSPAQTEGAGTEGEITHRPSEADNVTGYGERNRIVTKESYETAVSRIKDKLDPNKLHDITDFASLLPDLVEIGVYHVEAGAREFGAWSKRLLADLGEDIRPHLQTIWNETNQRMESEVRSPQSEAGEVPQFQTSDVAHRTL